MNISEINNSLFRMVNNLGKEFPFTNLPMIIIAEYTVFFLAIFVILFWFTKNKENKMMLICGGISFILAETMGKVAGLLHFNQQPFAVLSNTNQLIEKTINNSFPSDHTILFFSFCMSFWLFKKGKWIVWVLLAILVGVSRIWVGVHYPLDVLVGAFIGIASTVIIYFTVPSLTIITTVITKCESIEKVITSKFHEAKKSKV
ncbi:undecaprenyl-diphosphatase [Lysinibacillus sp. Ag94]|uniref:undecaprenyl-diphosphatase n=1 Tax=Lysinibacillus sp. Ag94 TaxID=2936682 RepID=UPI00200DC0F2|nr:undecaprenyl-diphosphatase [Lysinibacillus sp. Ag94]UPW81304.1 undecaprenyl-diphosphatase [Lysinibacillus sp. Ag94]